MQPEQSPPPWATPQPMNGTSVSALSPPAPPPWLVQPGAPSPGPAPRGRRGLGKASIIGVIAGVVLLGAGTFASNAYAKHTICSSLSDGSTISDSLAGGSSDEPSADTLGKMREAGDQLRGYGHMLVFDRDLKSAVNGFADDIDQLADLMGSTDEGGDGLAQLLTLAGSVNNHVRQAQQACDLPVKGIFSG